MSWQDRDHAGDEPRGMGRPGGDWQGLQPSFDNPFSWALTIGRVARISIRVHIFFVVFITIMLLRAALPPAQGQQFMPIGVTLMAITMGALFLIVLLHEFGHCFACRWSGGEADEILLWPLGGLAFARPPHHWRAHLMTVLGGPAVNVIICAITGVVLGAWTGKWWGVAIPNPLTLDGILDVSHSLILQALFLINATSLILLLFNLLPVFPLDGGRIVQSVLWSRFGFRRSMVLAVRTGYVGAIAMFIFGAVVSNWTIMIIALFGAFTCYLTQKQVQFSDSMLEFETDDYGAGLGRSGDDASPKPTVSRRAERQAEREAQEAREVDRILQKIADSGIDSLSRGERALLKRVTERKRQRG